MPYTIIDVARRAGVSKSTVSRVLSGGYVSGIKRQAVVRVMEELGYNPSAPARMLVTNRSKTLGLLVHDFSDPYYAPIVRGASRKAMEMGYDVMLSNRVGDEYEGGNLVQRLSERKLDGIIAVVYTPASLPEDGETLSRIVAVSPASHNSPIRHVEVDYRAGAMDAVEYLISLGHERIAHIAGPEYSYAAELRREGYIRAMEAGGLTPRITVSTGFSKEEGREAVHGLLDFDIPTAVFAVNDKIALGVWAEARVRGLRVPQDLSIVGFDDLECLTLADVPLTTIRQPFEEMGSTAVGILLDGLQGKDENRESVVLRHELVVRGSSGPPPISANNKEE